MSHLSNRTAMEAFLARLLAHSTLSKEEQAAVAALPTSRVEVSANRDLVSLGEGVDHAILVERGLMGRFGQTEDGKRQFISLHIPGEMPTLSSVMVPEADASLTALTKSTVLRVPHRALRDLDERYPAIAAAFSRDSILNAEIVAQWLVNVGRRDSRTRMSHLLCEMALRYANLGNSPALRYELPMTQEQLGDALALTSVHVNRTLMSLREAGFISVSKGVVQIHDWEGLVVAGEFDATYLHLGTAQSET